MTAGTSRVIRLAMYELQYEELLRSRSQDLFPNYICSRFKKFVTSPLGDSQADLFLVDKDYRRSYVVEVELVDTLAL